MQNCADQCRKKKSNACFKTLCSQSCFELGSHPTNKEKINGRALKARPVIYIPPLKEWNVDNRSGGESEGLIICQAMFATDCLNLEHLNKILR